MRLLVIGHTYLTEFAQAKFVAMKQLDPELELRIVIPPKSHHVFTVQMPERAAGLTQDELVLLPTVFGRSHMTYIHHPGHLAALLRDFRPDHVHIEEDPHSMVGFEAVMLARSICRNATISFFLWDNLNRTPRFPVSLVKQILTRLVLLRGSLVICGNSEGQRLLADKGYSGMSLVLPQLGLNPEEYTVTPLPEVRAQIPADPDAVVVGFLGRMIPEKGILHLLEGLSQLEELPWKLLLLGSGPLKTHIETRWQPAFGDRLTILDAVPHRIVPHCLRCLDIFVLPSYSTGSWKEQFGLTLAQAMMAGVACIGSSSGAIPDVLGPGGLIFPERDVEGLKTALRQMIESRDTREQFGRQGQKFALEHYSNRAVALAYLDAFSNVSGLRTLAHTHVI